MIDEKITRYKNSIEIAKEISKRKYVDHDYYDKLISKFEKILRFYEDLKVWKEFSRS
ncbi:MAG: hypothetical protein JSV62_12415 [Promethearchaeota archaeon]|nr:MAG: hypothetical protein JSV62_12415 [Candidatus Lokiarchaeota archaeon]